MNVQPQGTQLRGWMVSHVGCIGCPHTATALRHDSAVWRTGITQDSWHQSNLRTIPTSIRWRITTPFALTCCGSRVHLPSNSRMWILHPPSCFIFSPPLQRWNSRSPLPLPFPVAPVATHKQRFRLLDRHCGHPRIYCGKCSMRSSKPEALGNLPICHPRSEASQKTKSIGYCRSRDCFLPCSLLRRGFIL